MSTEDEIRQDEKDEQVIAQLSQYQDEEDDVIEQQAALAQAKYKGLKIKSPMLHESVSFTCR